MKIKASWLASAFVVASVLVGVTNNGCGDDDEDEAARGPSRKGEACQTTRDCVTGLSCIPTTTGAAGGTCVVGVFGILPTTKECVIVQCQTALDCCANPSAQCRSLKQQCDFQRDAGITTGSSCQTYEQACKCDENNKGCEEGLCIDKCVDDDSCVSSGRGSKCLGGRCGQCSGDDECKAVNPDYACVNAQCRAPCKGDGDCEGFDRCVNGKCTAGGCQTARECVAMTKNVEATCGTDGKCIQPCQTDLECGRPRGYGFASCIGGRCVDVGCETEKDCQLSSSSLTTSSSSTSSTGGFPGDTPESHFVCREKTTPGPIPPGRR